MNGECHICKKEYEYTLIEPDAYILKCPFCNEEHGAIGKQEFIDNWFKLRAINIKREVKC